jgi:hypothetical protein
MDLDPELVGLVTTEQVAVDGGEQEAVVPGSIDRAAALVLRPRAGDHQPLVNLAVEVQVAGLELELRLARGDVGALLVLRREPEIRLADRVRELRGGARR